MAVDITGIGTLYDSLEGKAKITLDEQWNLGRLTGSDYAQVLSGSINTAMQIAVRTVQNQPIVDGQVAQAAENLKLSQDTHASKVSLAKNQSDKVLADIGLITAQKDGIIQQVIDNRKIKALNSLANTYGTFGAGGLTLSADMWTTYFNLASDLSGVAAPTGTTVSRV